MCRFVVDDVARERNLLERVCSRDKDGRALPRHPKSSGAKTQNKGRTEPYSKTWGGNTIPGPSTKQATGLAVLWKFTQYALVSVIQ